MPLNATIIGQATDNIADWSNDITMRLETIKTLTEANLTDTGRIAEQVVIIREEIQNPTG